MDGWMDVMSCQHNLTPYVNVNRRLRMIIVATRGHKNSTTTQQTYVWLLPQKGCNVSKLVHLKTYSHANMSSELYLLPPRYFQCSSFFLLLAFFYFPGGNILLFRQQSRTESHLKSKNWPPLEFLLTNS